MCAFGHLHDSTWWQVVVQLKMSAQILQQRDLPPHTSINHLRNLNSIEASLPYSNCPFVAEPRLLNFPSSYLRAPSNSGLGYSCRSRVFHAMLGRRFYTLALLGEATVKLLLCEDVWNHDGAWRKAICVFRKKEQVENKLDVWVGNTSVIHKVKPIRRSWYLTLNTSRFSTSI